MVDAEELRAARSAVRATHVAEAVLQHAIALVRSTRDDPRMRLGASSRAAITLVRCAQARAVVSGRDYVAPDDIRALAVPVLAHRLVLAAPADGFATGSLAPEAVVAELAGSLPVPLHA